MKRFESQTAVITGGAQGIGFAIAEKLASEGASVWLLDRNSDLLASAADTLIRKGLSAQGLALDITNEGDVAEAFRTIGTCSVVINAAGIVGPTGIRTDEVALTDFIQTIQVNLTGSFIITQYALKNMLPTGYGRILLLASIAGKEGNAGMAAYSASKAGVIGLAKSAGKEYAETGITVNALAPATIMTPMVQAMPDHQVKYMTDKIPMKRCGSLQEIASLAAWIVSPEASFNTGFTFDMTGGRAVY